MNKHVRVAVIFFILTIVVTFPLFFKAATHFPGFFSSDENYAPLWDSWRINYSLHHNISLKHTPLVAHPFGWDLYSSGYWSYLWMAVFYLLSIFTTPALTYNIQVVTNFLLSGFVTYALVFYLTKNRLSAVFSGVIFAFCPYQFMRVWQHLSLTYSEWIPLCLFMIILLKDQPIKRNFILFLVSLLLLLSFDYSIMFLGTITLGCFLMYGIYFQLKTKFLNKKNLFTDDRKFIKKVFLALILVATILTPQFFTVIKTRFKGSAMILPSAFNSYHRSFEDLFSQSAKPLGYLLPASMHPIFGKFTEGFVGTAFYGESFTEHTLYLGWVPLVLAFLAIKRWKENRSVLQGSQVSSLQEKESFYIGFFVFLATAAWLFSQPPWWSLGPLKIYLPSFFMYKILPMYRAYCRFGIVVMLAVSVLAGFGLKFILERFKDRKTQIALGVLFCGLVLFEFWNYPPFKVIDISKAPAVYDWLKETPGDFAIAEYPLDNNSPNEMYKFYQTKHEKKIINGTIPGTYANQIAQTITSLSEPKTAARLKWMGVKYVLVHTDGYLQTELIEDKDELGRIPANNGLKLIKNFPAQECPDNSIMCVRKSGPIAVYEIIAAPTEPKIGG